MDKRQRKKMPVSAKRGGKKNEAPAPRIGPGSTFDSVPSNIVRHMNRYSNKIVVNFDTVNLKVIWYFFSYFFVFLVLLL